ncbi:hypothetical protein [Comamonas sp. JC664]|uniref:hypothetical protein n=1 Tax=Comamonas sp. JC664 TaxID=2801917 RepID=UPI00366E779F
MSGKFFAHPFDARSVMLFASIAVTSAMAHAQPLNSSQQRIGQAASGSRIIQVERQLGTMTRAAIRRANRSKRRSDPAATAGFPISPLPATAGFFHARLQRSGQP